MPGWLPGPFRPIDIGAVWASQVFAVFEVVSYRVSVDGGKVVPSSPFAPGPSIVYFLTHPDVEINPRVPVPEWGLSEHGEKRMRSFRRNWMSRLGAVYASPEKKARVSALILAENAGFSRKAVRTCPELAENDRSATGYLPPEEFEITSNLFFKHPKEEIRGWESANNAQRRIINAVAGLLERKVVGDVAICSHGAVGALLLCHLMGVRIDRGMDQPRNGGGNYFAFDADSKTVLHGWRGFEG